MESHNSATQIISKNDADKKTPSIFVGVYTHLKSSMYCVIRISNLDKMH